MTRGFSADCIEGCIEKCSSCKVIPPHLPPNKYSFLRERNNHILIPYRHLNQLFSCQIIARIWNKSQQSGKCMRLKTRKNSAKELILSGRAYLQVFGETIHAGSPYNTAYTFTLPCHIITGQSELNYTISKDTILPAVPSSLHRSRLFQPLPRLACMSMPK